MKDDQCRRSRDTDERDAEDRESGIGESDDSRDGKDNRFRSI